MPTYSFTIQIVVPEAWSLLLLFLGPLIFFFGRRRFNDVFELCTDKFLIMRRWTEEHRLRKQKILKSILSAVIIVLVLFLCYNYFPFTIRSVAEKKVEVEYNKIIIPKPLLPIQPMPEKELENKDGKVTIPELPLPIQPMPEKQEVDIKDENVIIEELPLPIQPIPVKKVDIKNETEVIVEPIQPMSKNAFYVLIGVLLFSVLGGLAFYFGEQVFSVYMLCTSYFHALSGWVGGGLRRLVNMYMCCIDYFHSMSRFGGRLVDLFSQWMSKKKVDIKSEEVKTVNPVLIPTQLKSTNTFNVQIPAISSFLGDLVVSFRGQVFNVYTFCTYYFYLICRWIGNLVGLVKRSRPSAEEKLTAVRELNEELHIVNPNAVPELNEELLTVKPNAVPELNEEVLTVNPNAVPELNEELLTVNPNAVPELNEELLTVNPNAVPELNKDVLTVNPHDNERLKNYIQTIIESLESLADEIQQPLLAENDVKSVLKRVDDIPGLIQKSIASLEFVHGKLYSSF